MLDHAMVEIIMPFMNSLMKMDMSHMTLVYNMKLVHLIVMKVTVMEDHLISNVVP
jgi:hypothetical protein